jgi:hypothetical protein
VLLDGKLFYFTASFDKGSRSHTHLTLIVVEGYWRLKQFHKLTDLIHATLKVIM